MKVKDVIIMYLGQESLNGIEMIEDEDGELFDINTILDNDMDEKNIHYRINGGLKELALFGVDEYYEPFLHYENGKFFMDMGPE